MSKILVATPAERGIALVHLLSAMGLRAEAIPVMNYVEPENLEWVKDQIDSINPQDHLIFVSPQSVKSFKKYLNFMNTENIYALGPGTAESLKNNFEISALIFPKEPGSINSEGLWALIKDKIWQDQKVFILRGGEGNHFLAEKLEQAGADLIFLDLYKRQCAWENRQLLWAALLTEEDLRLVILTSLEMIEYFFDLLDQKILSEDLIFTSPSEKASEYLRSKGIKKIILLDNMSHWAIAEQVQKCLEQAR